MMKPEVDTGHTVTAFIFLWPDGDSMEYIQDCHIHLLRVEESSNVWILGTDWTTHVQVRTTFPNSRGHIKLRCTLTVMPFDEKLQFSSSVIFSVLTIVWTGSEVWAHPTRSRDASCNTWHFLLPVGGAKTAVIQKYYRFYEVRMDQQSYSSVLDKINLCKTELQPMSPSWWVFKVTTHFPASLQPRPLVKKSYNLRKFTSLMCLV